MNGMNANVGVGLLVPENHIDDYWLKQIDTFRNYRRMLLYTCMQGYPNQNTELKNGFLSMIKETPNIDRFLL